MQVNLWQKSWHDGGGGGGGAGGGAAGGGDGDVHWPWVHSLQFELLGAPQSVANLHQSSHCARTPAGATTSATSTPNLIVPAAELASASDRYALTLPDFRSNGPLRGSPRLAGVGAARCAQTQAWHDRPKERTRHAGAQKNCALACRLRRPFSASGRKARQ